jgi:hypothetical protein
VLANEIVIHTLYAKLEVFYYLFICVKVKRKETIGAQTTFDASASHSPPTPRNA